MVEQLRRPVDIIIAEDDDDDFLLIQNSFAAAKCANTIIRARDGVELMELLQRRLKKDGEDTPRSVVILLDLNMPRKDGREALREIRDNPGLRMIPVIVLTTSRSDEDMIRAYDLGVNCFIRKPVSFEDFNKIIMSLKAFWLEFVEFPPIPPA